MAKRKNNESNIVDYKCHKCHYVKLKKKDEVLKKMFLQFIITILSMAGFFAIVVTLILSPALMGDLLSSSYMTIKANVDTDELRQIAIDSTEKCGRSGLETNAFCYTFELFKNMTEVRYVPMSFYRLIETPSSTYFSGGDCKSMSTLYVSMVKSVGFGAKVVCAVGEEHCIAVVPLYDYYEITGQYAVVDLTMPAYFIMEDGQDLWDYREIGSRFS